MTSVVNTFAKASEELSIDKPPSPVSSAPTGICRAIKKPLNGGRMAGIGKKLSLLHGFIDAVFLQLQVEGFSVDAEDLACL